MIDQARNYFRSEALRGLFLLTGTEFRTMVCTATRRVAQYGLVSPNKI